MSNPDAFIKAYHDFKDSVDFSQPGALPDVENLYWGMLMGIPSVPADDNNDSLDAQLTAVDQRVVILKAVFVEVNKNQTDDFLDKGLIRYDKACKITKKMLKEMNTYSDTDDH